MCRADKKTQKPKYSCKKKCSRSYNENKKKTRETKKNERKSEEKYKVFSLINTKIHQKYCEIKIESENRKKCPGDPFYLLCIEKSANCLEKPFQV